MGRPTASRCEAAAWSGRAGLRRLPAPARVGLRVLCVSVDAGRNSDMPWDYGLGGGAPEGPLGAGTAAPGEGGGSRTCRRLPELAASLTGASSPAHFVTCMGP